MDNPNNTLPSQNNLPSTTDALRLWVQRHKPVIDILLDAFAIVDVQNRVVDFNVAFNELCGESYRKTLKIGNFCELLPTERCPENCPAKEILITGKPVRIDELKAHSKAYPNLQMIVGGVPIYADNGGPLLGAMLTLRNVSAEMELQKKYGDRKQDSVTDGLTHLYNKVYTENMLLKFTSSAIRETQALSVIMCDIDHFKRVNDSYGHQAGDYVLALVAKILKETSRESDVIGRFGGEEFIAVLPMTNAVGAKAFAERFRRNVEQTKFIFEGKHIPVTASLGIATHSSTWNATRSVTEQVTELISQADTSLYYAKANGRNQSVLFDSLPAGASTEAAAEMKKKKASER